MKVKELIELNQMITDIEITVRKNGTALLDQLNIGLSEGIEPPFPTMVPTDERYIGNMSECYRRKAHYIKKSINAWDDGKDYWQIKPDRIPKKWLELEVYAWEVWQASTCVHGKARRNDYGYSNRNVNFHGQRAIITALPSGESLEIKKSRQEPEAEEEDEINLFNWKESGENGKV